MINIDTEEEYRKGILFIRIKGDITKKTQDKYYDNVITLIKNNGIRNIVLNLERVEKLDLKGINLLFYTYELTRINKGKLYFTNINTNIKKRIDRSHILRYVDVLKNELESYSKIIV